MVIITVVVVLTIKKLRKKKNNVKILKREELPETIRHVYTYIDYI